MKTNAGTSQNVGTMPEAVGDTGNVWRDIVAAMPEVEILGSGQEMLKRLTDGPVRDGHPGREELLRMICEDTEVTDAWKALARVVARLDSPTDTDTPRIRARDRGWRRGIERMGGRDETDEYGALKRGLRLGKTTGRILTGDARIGTGFLAGPGLLLTTNQVIGNRTEAESAVVTFDHELQDNGLPAVPAHFHITGDVFMTSPELDYCFVSVAPVSIPGQSTEPRYLSEYGFTPLAPETGKTAKGELINLLQHPDGGLKTIASNENLVLGYEGDHVYYVAGKQRVSSGALVCNPQWFCVALHQMAIPDPRDPSKSIASRGVRISSILDEVSGRRQSGDPDAITIERLIAEGRRPFALETDRRKLGAEADGADISESDFDDPDDLMLFDIGTEDDDRYYGPEPQSEDEYYQYEWDDDNDRCEDDDDLYSERAEGDDEIRLACLNGQHLDHRS